MNRREFLINTFKMGGAVACASLGFSPPEIIWASNISKGKKKEVGGGCAGGTSAGLGSYSASNNFSVDNVNILVYSEWTADASSDGEVNTINAATRLLASGNYINGGIWLKEDANTATLLADGPNTDQGANGLPDVFAITLDSTPCLVNGNTYIIGVVVSGTDTDFDFYRSAYSGGLYYYSIAMTGGATLTSFNPSSATPIEGYSLEVSATYE